MHFIQRVSVNNRGLFANAGIAAAALLALWDVAAARCSDAGSWCMHALSGSRTSSSAHSFQEGSSHHYYQAVPDDMPAEYWVCCPPQSSLLLRKADNRCWVVHPALRVCNTYRAWGS